jgi:hypothetical protein
MRSITKTTDDVDLGLGLRHQTTTSLTILCAMKSLVTLVR